MWLLRIVHSIFWTVFLFVSYFLDSDAIRQCIKTTVPQLNAMFAVTTKG